MEEDDRILIEEEKLLTQELKILQEKHKNVKLIYENIIDNIKNINKVEKKDEKKDETNLNNSTIENKSQMDLSNIVEDDIIKQYNEILSNMKNKVENLFMIQTHEQFKEIMRSKGYEPATSKSKSRTMLKNEDTRLFVDLKKEKSEYERNDELLKDEDNKIYKARTGLIEEYKRKEDEKVKAVEKEKAAKK
jgi:hypothetical protein